MRTAKNTASAAAKTIAPRRPSPSRLLLMMDSDADSTYSSLIAKPDWLLLAMVEAADPRSHRGDPPVFCDSPVDEAKRASAPPDPVARDRCSTPGLECHPQERREARIANRAAACGRRRGGCPSPA